MTEDEAKTKWCPFAITDMYARAKRLEDHAAWPIAGFATCIGRACMAWRWRDQFIQGYCGLAGKQE